jgi:predicted RNA-binding protein with PUA-like domain
MKSEPDVYSIDDLERDGRTGWEGVRNYQARNMLRDQMRPGDEAFFYHSSCEVPAVVGIVEIAGPPRPDATQFDKRSDYYDPKSKRDDPRWWMVDVVFRRKLARPVTLAEIRDDPAFADFTLTRRGNRLSVFPVSAAHWRRILELEKRKPRS